MNPAEVIAQLSALLDLTKRSLAAALASDVAAVKAEAAARPVENPFPDRGLWKPRTTYAKRDRVSYRGGQYVAIQKNTNTRPGTSSKDWLLLAGGGGSLYTEGLLGCRLDAGATITWPMLIPTARVVIGAAANAFRFIEVRTGGTYILSVIQDGTGGRTVTWPSNVRWPGGVTPTLTTTANRADVFSFIYDGTVFYGSYNLNLPSS